MIQEETNQLLQKQAILILKEFISTIFLVPKKSWGIQPITGIHL